MNRHFKALALAAVLFGTFNLSAQTTIQDQYKDFYGKASTWEEYKLIKMPGLTNFWSVVTDTLNNQNDRIRASAGEIRDLKSQLSEVKNQVVSLEASLTESESLNDSISFLGIGLSKSLYNLLVWLLIFALAFGIGSFYLMFKRSNNVTLSVKRDYENLETEFEKHKIRARENQIKIKRELQTALNSLHEQGVN